MVRKTSSTTGIDDLDVERCYGDVFDDEALRAAMAGCDVVYYCVVDARMWLRDPAPLFRTNVEGLRHVLDAAVDAGSDEVRVHQHHRHIGDQRRSRPVTEDDPHNWTDGGAVHRSPDRSRGPGAALCPRPGPASRRDVHLDHLRAWGLAADATRLAHRAGRGRPVPVLPRLLLGGRRHRRCCARNASRGRAGHGRGALHHLRSLSEHPRGARDRG